MKEYTYPLRKILLLFVCLLIGSSIALWAQTRQVSGVVTENGQPLIGVSVALKGSTTAVVTDGEGRYTISVPEDATLVFSFIGMKTQEVEVGSRSVINVTMETEVTQLEDVVIVAFGTAKKEAFTGSAATINSDRLSKRVTTNVANAIAGQLAGVQIRSSDGAPGSGPTLRIRGFTSLYAGKDPLIIVDGAPYTGSLSTINTSDIETYTVLKDAAANALYGARAANGVIMITTKKAKKGATVTVDAKVGVKNHSVVEYDVIRDPAQYYETYYGGLYNYYFNRLGQDATTASANANQTMLTRLGYNVYETNGQPLIGIDGKLNPNATLGRVVNMPDGSSYYLTPDDWRDYTYKQGIRQEYDVNFSAGNDKASFYASAGYLNEDGIVDRSNFTRYTARLKADYQAKKWLKVGGNIAYYNFEIDEPGGYDTSGSSGNIFSFSSVIAPIYPLFIRDGAGNILYDEHGMKRYDYGDRSNAGLSRPYLENANPLSDVLLNETSYNGSTFNLYGFVDINFTNKLKLQVNATSYLSEYRTTDYTNPYYGQYATSNGMIYKAHNRTNNLNIQQLLTYTDQIGDHSFDVMLGHEYTNEKTFVLSGQRNGIFSPYVFELNHAVNVVSASSSATEYNVEGFFGRAQYNYDEKYYASVSYRRDASSRFHPDDRWGNFWSVGGAWLLNKESFLSNVSWMDLLKFKISYGSNGNDQIGNDRYTDIYNIENSGGQAGITFNLKGNQGITWETNANFNTGFEFEFFENRIAGSVEYYNRMTYDLLFLRPAPESSGYSSFYDNIGDMSNYGFEIDLRGYIFKTTDFEWALNANLSTVKNVMLELPPERMKKENGFATGNKWIGKGGSIYDFYLFKYAGVNEFGEALYYKKVKDADDKWTGENTTTTNPSDADQYHDIGSSIPDFFGGFGSTVYYKGFDFSINFDYQVGGLVYDGVYASMMSSPSATGVRGSAIHQDILKAWSPTNTSSNIPRYQDNEAYNQNAASDRFLVNASYLNLQNINVGYTFPSKWTQKININTVRLYAAIENIAYWSKRKGLDPRQDYDGSTTNQNYGISRSITGGVQITF
ncbi:MAG: TonB-dependent receptor [Prevotellaceae bacterium]|jgi:TonB-linked SusC/RagA family outer membrane protein|nr:TonB-dependent receptor [Prevotellaceae bacterium]